MFEAWYWCWRCNDGFWAPIGLTSPDCPICLDNDEVQEE